METTIDKQAEKAEAVQQEKAAQQEKDREAAALAAAEIKERKQKSRRKRGRMILAYSANTGRFVGAFFTQREAAETLGLYQTAISMQINGKIDRAGDYTFRYLTDREHESIRQFAEMIGDKVR